MFWYWFHNLASQTPPLFQIVCRTISKRGGVWLARLLVSYKNLKPIKNGICTDASMSKF